jgi:DNA-binding NarL/FixJ family response regulator
VGRREELARVQSLLEAARGGAGGILVIEGEAGIGKTTLLDAAQQMATGFQCLWARGVESESVLGHGALLELVSPVHDRLADIPSAQSEALASALGWGPAETPADRFLVAAATLSVLAAAAEQTPVLVLVDDLQWVDQESAAALLFAARRLGRDAVAFLFAVRTGSTPPPLLAGLPVLALGGLSATTAAGMLPDGLAGVVVDSLVEGTGGNPLALLEVTRHLTRAQRVGAAPLPSPLPAGSRLRLVYETLLAGLSDQAWWAVLLCAVSTQGASAVPLNALAADGVDAGAALDEAEEQGVLVRDEAGMRFRHPLLRSAALGRASPAKRRAAHRALARALPGESAWAARTWHLAEASAGNDDALADELVQVAAENRVRRGFAAASAALERAALLTSLPDIAAERLAAAAEDAFVAGDVQRTRMLVARVLDGPSGPGARARVLFCAGMLELYTGSVPRAAELLAETAVVAEGELQVQTLAELGLCRFRLNDMAGVVECADRITEAADGSDPGQRVLAGFTRGMALMVTGDPAAAQPLLAEVMELAVSPALADDPRYLIHLALAAGFLGDLRHAVAVGGPRVALVRERGAVGVLVPCLSLLAAGRAWLGDHAGAFADAGEAAELAEQLGYAADAAPAVEMLAWQSAARGLHDDARRALEQARVLTDRAGTTGAAARQAITAAFCALCEGDLEKAAALLEARIAIDGGVGSMGEPLGVAPTLVEAYVGLGRRSEAAALAQQYADDTPQPAAPVIAALVARCRALASTDEDAAAEAFEAALTAHAIAPEAFEEARTRLLYGAMLRRGGRRVAAREQLRTAHDAFVQMDLTAWVARAADELAATGASARPRRPLATEPLTSQETRVALLVAQGLSNREVAAALFLSPKTIEHHLSSVFRKRGFRSRTELARTFATGEP